MVFVRIVFHNFVPIKQLFVGPGRVYYIVGLSQILFVKPAPTMAGRGGFYQQYLRLTNNLYKPAPTQPITQINLILEIDHPKKCKFRFPTQGRVYYIVGFRHRWLVKPAPTMACRGGFYQLYLRLPNNLSHIPQVFK